MNSKPIEQSLFFALLAKIHDFFFLQVLKPRPRGHPFYSGDGHDIPFEKRWLFSYLLKLENLKIRESQKELYLLNYES